MEKVFFPLFSIFSILPHVSSTLSFIDSSNPRVLLSAKWQPIPCSHPSLVPTCNSYLYVEPHGHSPSEIAAIYSANTSLIEVVNRSARGAVDFLVQVPCTCAAADDNTTIFFFHDTKYTVELNDTPENVTGTVFSGLAWDVGEPTNLTAGENITVQLVCGCLTVPTAPGLVISYAVQVGDTLGTIADLLNSNVELIRSVNPNSTANPEFLSPGTVLFVPTGVGAGSPPRSSTKGKTRAAVIVATPISAAFLLVCGLTMFFRIRNHSNQSDAEDPKKKLEKTFSARSMNVGSIAELESHYLRNKKTEDIDKALELDRPVVFSLEAVGEATANFDEKRKIGEGGYGSVYLGMLGSQEVAIKKMRANKSKEFFAELKVLCKVHHINVVELIGYAAGGDHLYLIYEYVQNGSLSEHLHDPLLKGHQPLSWSARIQIALDAARGIEYIHDHTKACYVHRDIKTSNILLDNGLRAKVADFGLAKLVERSGEDEFLATRLVGTPGYLPPESVRELQMTPKVDVFAFGVVLAELITGLRALIRDNKEPSKMRTLVSTMKRALEGDDQQNTLETIIDGNLKDNYPIEEVHKMAAISLWCLSDDPMDRPEMREVMTKLSHILMASIEWEASLGGNGEVFSGVFNGR
ncbi:lysM domain receptor-like kinase 3 [Ananas comosus]|uniref:LysM domain receptor-like kinase 3 n=1 Tax=Ananas comosus TaxID=4615 RepID=A0A6P5FC04_ANACO|nr:lysM domain receptor-like kinase 3 [Ananas comosus]